jgi:hypothetical protein
VGPGGTRRQHDVARFRSLRRQGVIRPEKSSRDNDVFAVKAAHSVSHDVDTQCKRIRNPMTSANPAHSIVVLWPGFDQECIVCQLYADQFIKGKKKLGRIEKQELGCSWSSPAPRCTIA